MTIMCVQMLYKVIVCVMFWLESAPVVIANLPNIASFVIEMFCFQMFHKQFKASEFFLTAWNITRCVYCVTIKPPFGCHLHR